jgi:GNAT superfamily N-acetyltransferase
LAIGVSIEPPSFPIHELPIPQEIGGEGWADFEASLKLHFDNEALIYGTDDIGFTATEAWPSYVDYEHEPVRLFVTRDEDAIVARGYYETEPGDDPQTAWLHVDVRPSHRHRGLGSAMVSWLHGVAATDGIRKAIVYAPSADADAAASDAAASADSAGDRIPAPTGFGSLPADNTEVRLLLGNEYRLEQIVRGSRLELPVDVGSQLAESVAATAPDYLLHYWIDRTPERWREDMAMLRQRMSTEEPSAGLEEPEDVWTVKRLIAEEERNESSPRTFLVAAIESVASGHLIGFTTVSTPAEIHRSVAQEDTLVLPEHRGHRLGTLLKLANLDHLQRERPGHPSVITFNAEENRHMLNVNEAVGFVPIGYEGAWRKNLPY